jgi:hypothetical protein
MNKKETRAIKTGNSAFELAKKLGKDNIYVKNAAAFEAMEWKDIILTCNYC